MKRLLLCVAALPLTAGTCGVSDEGEVWERYSYEGDDGPSPVFEIQFREPPFPERHSTLELSEADAALTRAAEETIESQNGGGGFFVIKLAIEFGDLTYPYCFGDDVVLNQVGSRSVIAPAGSVCIDEPLEAHKFIYLSLEE